MKKLVICSTTAILMFFLFSSVGFAGTSYYNYTQNTTLGHRAYYGNSNNDNSSSWVPPNPFYYIGDMSEKAGYDEISYIDNQFAIWATIDVNYEWDILQFHLNISENPQSINRMNFTWLYHSYDPDTGYKTWLQIWNVTGQNWVELASSPNGCSVDGYNNNLCGHFYASLTNVNFSHFVNISGSNKWIYVYAGHQQPAGGGGGSCPFIYSWNGSDYIFEHEAYPFAVIKVAETTTYDRLHSLKEDNGELKIKIKQVLRERDWTDSFKLFAIEHPGNDSFVMPDYNGNYHTIKNLIEPISCVEHLSGKDCLKEVKYFDGLAWKDSLKQANVNNEKTLKNWIVLEFPKPENVSKAKLFFSTMKQKTITQEWEYYIDQIGENYWDFWQWFTSSVPSLNKIFQKLYLNMYEREIKQHIQIWNGDRWVEQGSVSAGDSLWDDFLIVLDISKIKEDKLKVRFYQTTGHYTINYVAIDYSEDESMKVKEIKPYYAVKNGKENVLDLLLENDEKYVFLLPNDVVELKYKAPEKREWKIDYAISIKGYYNFINFKNQTFFGFLSGIIKWLKAILIPYNVPKTVYQSGYIHNTWYHDYFGVVVEYTDIQAPFYSLNSTNSTLAGTVVSHNLKWNDDTGLSGFHFLFHNGSYSWFTPLSVHSFCSEASPFYANNTIDNDLASEWQDFAHEHWIVYDFGVPLNISKLRMYTDPPSDGLSPCAITAIYITNDTSNFGSSLGSCVLTGTTKTWRECSFSPKVGRYIKIIFNTTDLDGVICGNTYQLVGFYEFQVYSEFVVDPWRAFTSEVCPNPYTECWSNVTKVINSTVGATIKWKVYANDTNNNWNVSEEFSYVTTSECSLAIGLSNTLASGIAFGNINPGEIKDALGNNGNATTDYYVVVSISGCNPNTANIYIKASSSLTSGSYSIPLANFKFRNSTTDNTVPSSLQNISLTTSYLDNKIGSLLSDGSYVYLKFVLEVPSSQRAGNYSNTVYFWAGRSDLSPPS
ncbi:MAG: discoidin domain-containing protein [Candidatus Aenigmatarchaeota archaeon]